MNSIAVFCGSSMPNKEIYKDQILKLADYFIEHKIKLIYGGASIGLMGLLADRILEQGGYVIGIMPEVLAGNEIIHQHLTETHIVKDMAERKQLLIEMANHFIAYPGGCGTMDEIFEVITLSQIGLLDKSFGFLNIDSFYEGIETYLNKARSVNLLSSTNRNKILIDSDINTFMSKLIPNTIE